MRMKWGGWASEEQVQKLRKAGIDNHLELALTSSRRLASYGFGRNEALELIKNAQRSISSASRGHDIIRRRDAGSVLSTGSTSLNNILNGGVKTGLITDFFGESGTGKTQIAFQLCVNASVSGVKGALGGDTIFIDSMGTFRPERITEMAEAKGLQGKTVLEKILVSEVRTLKEQLEMPRKIKDISTTRRLCLVVIDTLTENFLQTYGGEARLIQRQSLLAEHLHSLSLLALHNDLAVVITNMVRAALDNTSDIVEIGGDSVAQGVTVRIHLAQIGGVRKARLICPPLEVREAHYGISAAGITDWNPQG